MNSQYEVIPISSGGTRAGEHEKPTSLHDLEPSLAAAVIAATQADASSEYRITPHQDGYAATNAEQNLQVIFTPDKVYLKGQDVTAHAWGMALSAYGYSDVLQPVPAAALVAEGNRVEYQRGPITEWYVNGPLGLEQGFTLHRPPVEAAGKALVLELALDEDVTPTITEDGLGIILRKEDNLTWSYDHLFVADAADHSLPAHFELADKGRVLYIVVADHAAVYPIVVDPLIQQENVRLTASDGATGDYFGWWVALSSDGNTALIGASGKTSGTGAAYVFTRSGSTWTQQQELTASDAATGDRFGWGLALSSDGNTALVGAYGKSGSTGAAYAFTRSGSTWSQQQKLTASDGANADYFGYVVALSSDGNTALIGAYGKSTITGAAYAFTRSGSTWSQQQKLTASDAATNNGFGYVVALSSDGNTGLIGAPYKTTNTGAAYAFTRSGSTWSQQQELTAGDSATGDYFGISVALSSDGNTGLIGAFEKNAITGAAYAFTRSGSTWTQQQKLTANGGNPGDAFGGELVLSSDGNTALIGADGTNSNTGAAYIFTRSGSTWTQQQTFAASDGKTGDFFGLGIAMNSAGNTALIGTLYKNQSTGMAYIFLRPTAPSNTGQPSQDMGTWAGAPTSNAQINLYNGEKQEVQTDLTVPTPAGALAFQRTYRQSRLANFQFMGLGWTHNHNIVLLVNPPGISNGLVVVMSNGGEALFNQASPTTHYVAADGSTSYIDYIAGTPNQYVLTLADQTTFTFQLTNGTWLLSKRAWPTLTNLIVNGDMELDSDWSNISGHAPTTNARSNTQAYTGTYSRHVITNAASQGIQSDPFTLTANLSHTIAAWVYVVSGTVQMQLSPTTSVNASTSVTGSWQFLWATYTPGSTTTGNVLQFIGTTSSAEFYVDTVSILEANVLEEWDYSYDVNGHLTSVVDPNYAIDGSNTKRQLSFSYFNSGPFNGLLSQVSDHTGRNAKFFYTLSKKLNSSGTIVNDTLAVLSSVIDALGNTWNYSYYGQDTVNETDATQLNLLTAYQSPLVDTTGSGTAASRINLTKLSYTTSGTELVVNGNMESNSDWTNVGTPTAGQVTTPVHDGTHSWHVKANNTNQGIQSDAFTLVAGLTYIVTAWVNVVTDAVKMQLSTDTGATNAVSSGTGSWQLLRFLYQPRVSLPSTSLQFIGTTNAAEFYVDTVSCSNTGISTIHEEDAHQYADLIVNGDMELNSDWASVGTLTTNAQSNAQAHTGTYSRHVTTNAANQGIQSDAFTLTANLPHTITAWVYVQNGGVKMQLSPTSSVNATSSGTGAWQLLRATYTPGSTTTGNVLQFIGTTGGDDFYVDTVSILEDNSVALWIKDYTFQPSGLNQTTEVTAGATTTHQFNNGVYGAQTDPAGHTTTQLLNLQQRPDAFVDAKNQRLNLAWSADGSQLNKVTDTAGNTTQLTYNATSSNVNMMNTTTDALGRLMQYLYNDPNYPRLPSDIKRYDTDGVTVLRWQKMTYDTHGRLLTQKIVDPSNGTTILEQTTRVYYNTAGYGNGFLQTLTQKDVLGSNDSVTTYFYDQVGRVNQVNVSSNFGTCNSTFTLYDAADHTIATVCNYSSGSQPTTLAGVLALYNSALPLQNRITTFVFDTVGRQVNVTTNAQASYAQTALTSYDALHRTLRTIQNYVANAAITDPYVHIRSDFTHGANNDQNLIAEIAYNERGKVKSETDVLGNVTLYGYDINAWPIKSIQFASIPGYDNSAAGDFSLSKYVPRTDAPDKDIITTIQHDANGNIIAQTDPIGNTSFIVYDSLNRPIKTLTNASVPNYNLAADPTLANYVFSTAADQDLVTVTEYDAMGLVRRTQDVLGNWTLFGYDGLDRVVRTIRNASLPTYNFSTDRSLKNYVLSTAADTDLLTQTIYDSDSRVMETIDLLGRANWTAYDGLNRIIRSIANATGTAIDGGVHDPRSAYYNPVAASDQDQLSTIVYDTSGRAYRTQDRLGNWTLLGFDALNRVIKTVRNASNYNYSTAADTALVGYTPTTNSAPDQDVISQTIYDGKGRVAQTIDPLGQTTQYTYDQLDRPIQTIANYFRGAFNPSRPDQDLISTTAYDIAGRVISTTDPRGTVTTMTYDTAGRALKVTRAAGTTLTTTSYTCYDKAGRVLRTIQNYIFDPTQASPDARDSRGNFLFNPNTHGTNNDQNLITTFTLDKLGRTVTVGDPAGDTSSTTYYRDGSVESMTDPLSVVTKYRYDATRRQTLLVQSWVDNGQDPALWKWNGSNWTKSDGSTLISFGTNNDQNIIVQAIYDKAGRMTSRRDPRGKLTSYTYDLLNRRTKLTDPLSNNWTTSYSNLQNGTAQTQLTDPNTKVTQQTTDRLGRLASLQYLSESPKNTPDITFAYDQVGNVLSMTENNGGSHPNRITRYSYDGMYRLRSAAFDVNGDGSNIQTVSYGYDAGGLRTTLTLPGNLTATYTYDAKGRLISLSDWNSTPQTTTLSYDGADRPLTVVRNSGLTSSYTFDDAGRLTNLSHVNGANTLASFVYSVDARGNRTGVVETQALNPSGTDTHNIGYTYDNLARLTQAIQKSGGTLGSGTLQHQFNYAYDVAGNRTQEIVNLTGTPATTNYTYNNGDQLTSDGTHSFTYDSNGNLTSDGVNTYTWDRANRLLSMGGVSYTYDGKGQRISAGSTTYVPDVNAGLWKILSATTGANTLNYLHGPMGLHEQQNADGTWDWFIQDGLGSIRGVTSNSFAVQETRLYSPYGEYDPANSAYQTSGSQQTVYSFTGEQRDSNGLINLRARYLNPTIGQFFSHDPYEGSLMSTMSINPYMYANGNVINLTDPSGLAAGSNNPGSNTGNGDPWPFHFNAIALITSVVSAVVNIVHALSPAKPTISHTSNYTQPLAKPRNGSNISTSGLSAGFASSMPPALPRAIASFILGLGEGISSYESINNLEGILGGGSGSGSNADGACWCNPGPNQTCGGYLVPRCNCATHEYVCVTPCDADPSPENCGGNVQTPQTSQIIQLTGPFAALAENPDAAAAIITAIAVVGVGYLYFELSSNPGKPGSIPAIGYVNIPRFDASGLILTAVQVALGLSGIMYAEKFLPGGKKIRVRPLSSNEVKKRGLEREKQNWGYGPRDVIYVDEKGNTYIGKAGSNDIEVFP